MSLGAGSPPLCVRDADAADVDVIVEFNRLLAEESEGRGLDRALLRRGVELGLARPELCRYFIAEVGGRPVGQTMVTYELTDWRAGVLWWIQSVYVEPGSRRRGIFRRLFAHVRELAAADPAGAGLRLYVDRDNRSAMAVYEALGMRASDYVLYELDFRSS